MKIQIKILLVVLLSLFLCAPQLFAQIVDEQGQYVDTTFHDNVDRTAEDFVIASLLVADPGTVLYTVLGHACIRLQCPTFGMDYCFSYESEGVNNRVFDFLAGKLMMGLFAIPVEDYCAQYREEGRGVYEYKLNLPIEVKRELWRVLDEHLAEGIRLPYDYFHRGCAITAKQFVDEALEPMVIDYDKYLYENSLSVKEIWNYYTKNALWVRFLCYFIGGGREVEIPLKADQQLIIPASLLEEWQKATVNGVPLLASEPTVLVEGEPKVADGWFTPMVLAVLLLVLSVANLFWKQSYFDWLMLLAQTLVGCFMTYLICFSDLCCTEWNWLFIPFNLLPAICWKWRKYWALPYIGVMMIWCIAMLAITIWGHVLVDWPHIVLVVAWIMIMIKQMDTKIHNHSKIYKNR